MRVSLPSPNPECNASASLTCMYLRRLVCETVFKRARDFDRRSFLSFASFHLDSKHLQFSSSYRTLYQVRACQPQPCQDQAGY